MSNQSACKIRFVRRSQYADMLRSYQLSIDGTHVGKINRNDTFEIAVEAGEHRIKASIDWGRSQPLVIRAAPGETIEIDVKNRWSAWAAIWAISFGKNSYLKLTETGRRPNGDAPSGQSAFAASASTRR